MKETIYKIDKVSSNKIKLIGFFGIVALIFIHNGSGVNSFMSPSMIVSKNYTWEDIFINFIANGLIRFRMAFMMSVSGFFLFYKSGTPYLSLLKTKSKTIILPYLLISLSALVVTFLFETFFVPRDSVFAISGMMGKKMANLSIVEFIKYLLNSHIAIQMWYLRVLFTFILFSPVIRYILTKAPKLFLAAVLVIWICTNYIGGGIDDRGYIFFFLGAYFAIQKVDFSKPLSFFSSKLSFTIFVIIAVIKTYLTFYGQSLLGAYTAQTLSTLYKVNEIFGVYAVWFLFDKVILKMMENKFLINLTESSFFIYAFHAPLINFVGKIAMLSNNSFTNNKMLMFFMLPVLVLLVVLIVEDLLKRLSPKFYEILMGGRSKGIPVRFTMGKFRLPQVLQIKRITYID